MTAANLGSKDIEGLYARVRAGVDPETKQLHITEQEFTQAITKMITKALSRKPGDYRE